MSNSVYSIKGLKTHKGHEGEPVDQCSLYRDGRKIAEYSGDDHGGQPRWSWVYDVEEDILIDHCRTLPSRVFEDMKLPMDPDLFIEDLICASITAKDIKRKCKTKTCFRLRTQPKHEYLTMSMPFSAKVKSTIVAKYGQGLERIYNEEIVA